jgi:hypothetical protein
VIFSTALLSLALSYGPSQPHLTVIPSVIGSGAWTSTPALDEDTGTVSHVYWNGTTLVDTKGNTWTTNGTPTQSLSPVIFRNGFSATAQYGASNFWWSNGRNYILGTGSDVLDFAGDFTLVVIYSNYPPSDYSSHIFSNSGAGDASGYRLTSSYDSTKKTDLIVANTPTKSILMPGEILGLNIICAGVSGTTLMGRTNLGAWTTATGASSRVPGTDTPAIIGSLGANYPFTSGILYEFLAASTTPSDAACLAINKKFWNLYTKKPGNTVITFTRNSNELNCANSDAACDYVPAAVPSISNNGMAFWRTSANNILYSETLTNAAWTAGASVTVADSSASCPNAPFDSVNSIGGSPAHTRMSLITSPSDGLGIQQNVANGTMESIWLARATADANCTLSLSTVGGTSYSTVTLTATPTRFKLVGGADGTDTGIALLRLAGGCTRWCAWGAQSETATAAGPYYKTSGTAVTWPSAVASVASDIKTNSWCVRINNAKKYWTTDTATASYLFSLGIAGAANSASLYYQSGNLVFSALDATSTAKTSTAAIVAADLAAVTVVACWNAGLPVLWDANSIMSQTVTGTGTGIATLPATLYLGAADSSATSPLNGWIQEYKICKSGLGSQCK